MAQRREAGLTNDQGKQPTRTVAQILRANVLTRFNAILLALLVVILIVGPVQDALFGLILVANSGIGIFQELRAKRTLDRLSVLNAPTARAVRDSETVTVPAGQVVLDDVLELRSGDQVVIDGQVLQASGLEIDESLVSGEADPIGKEPGDDVLSGSFVVAGSGRVVAAKVGGESYAAKLTRQARGYSPARSEIRDAINRVLTWISWLLVIVGPLLLVTQLRSGQTTAEALRGSVAGLTGMVPEGLVLLTSVAMAVGVVRLASRRVLVQDLPAIEGLARVDVICCDKTGTLTEGSMHVVSLNLLGGGTAGQAEPVLGALAVADSRRNATMLALADRFADPGWHPVRTTAFSSARKWSAASFDGHGHWLIGAPEMLLADRDQSGVLKHAGRLAADGYRVLLLARSASAVDGDNVPARLEPVALVALAERIRADAESTLGYFASQDVSVLVISGDHPATVGAIARRLGLPGADRPVDARELPDDDAPGAAARLAEIVGESTVIGRVAPHQKQAIVAALQRRGHVVAMTGDGVNDVLALKNCDVGIAMGSGTPASRGAARLVLLDDKFATLPAVVAEGRRLIGNVDRVSRLFLTKACYVLLIALAITAARAPFPFYPRHLTVISTLGIGVPAFFLALAPNADRIAPGFLRRALRFAMPAGLVIAAASASSFLTMRDLGGGLGAARTGATVVATCLSLAVLAVLARPLLSWRGAMVLALAGAFAALFTLPWLRHQLALTVLPAEVLWSCVAVAAVGFGMLIAVWAILDRVSWLRPAGNAARQQR
ncbi:MAG TPA: HAD-IC family P-type ATPase [Streptosporangiaceae bacterium]